MGIYIPSNTATTNQHYITYTFDYSNVELYNHIKYKLQGGNFRKENNKGRYIISAFR